MNPIRVIRSSLYDAATAGDLSAPVLIAGPVFQSAVPLPADAPEPTPVPTNGSGALIPDELIVPHIRKDHVPLAASKRADREREVA